jgi:pimeloyl-ACP methyl ester carboxylesterase
MAVALFRAPRLRRARDRPARARPKPGTPRASIEAMSDWIAHFIESAGKDRAHVVGHSMGSLVALDTALRHRRCVDRLALLGTAMPMQVGEAFLAAARDDSPAAFDMETVWGHARNSLLSQSPVPGISLLGAGRQLNARAPAGVQHADLQACNVYRRRSRRSAPSTSLPSSSRPGATR